MSVCMSAVSAGISEVLIKYTGNVWLHCMFNVADDSLVHQLDKRGHVGRKRSGEDIA